MSSHHQVAHTLEAFSFAISAPYAEVFLLFGAHEERKWALGFAPEFLYPVPPYDQQGMVFTTVQEGLQRIWTNTCFDAATGHVQYVYWIAGTMTAWIDIHIQDRGPDTTQVEVVYERTALCVEANESVIRMAQADANCGPRWAQMINGYLEAAAAK